MPTWLADRVLSWASILDDQTRDQAVRTSQLPVVFRHVALMPDAHLGKGATVGSVIPTKNSLIPSAVGVDIGCGMVAVETDLGREDLPGDLGPLLERIAAVVPAGVGEGHSAREPGRRWYAQMADRPATQLTDKQVRTLEEQFGSLGAGNHYAEVCLDERERVWVQLHSGSRGIGNQLAQAHIRAARDRARAEGIDLPDRDLAWFDDGTPAFDAYVADLRFAQDYALANREQMMDAILAELFTLTGGGGEVRRVNCHHNYAAVEEHFGERVWVTRKGAIRARAGELGIVPGSMGAPTFIVQGRGESQSFTSCAHGAGRVHSRTQARKRFTEDDLIDAMGGRTWLHRSARKLLDESPGAYKDIDQVMRDQADLVTVRHTLTQVLNYKGL